MTHVVPITTRTLAQWIPARWCKVCGGQYVGGRGLVRPTRKPLGVDICQQCVKRRAA